MKPPQQSKKKRPKYDFKTTANGFTINGRHVVVEYKNKRQNSAPDPLHPPTNV